MGDGGPSLFLARPGNRGRSKMHEQEQTERTESLRSSVFSVASCSNKALVLVAWRPPVRSGRRSHQVDGARFFLRNRGALVSVARTLAATRAQASPGQRRRVRKHLLGVDWNGGGHD